MLVPGSGEKPSISTSGVLPMRASRSCAPAFVVASTASPRRRRAERLVVDIARERGAVRAVLAARIRRERELREALPQRIVVQQSPDQRIADAEQDLDRLDGFERADHTRQ